MTILVKIGYNIFMFGSIVSFVITHIAYHIVLGLHMAVCGTQNTTHANIESRIAPARPFRCPGSAKNHGALITHARFMLSSESYDNSN